MSSIKKRRREHGEACMFDVLPEDMVVEIIATLASSSTEPHVHLACIRSTCKSFKLAAGDRLVKRQINFSKAYDWKSPAKYSMLLEDCLDGGNPKAMYIKGMVDYFQNENTDAGINQLTKATNMGYIEAVYVLGMIYLSSNSTSNQGFELLHKANKRGCKERSRKRSWSILRAIWKNQRLPLREYECENVKCGMSRERRTRRWDEEGFYDQYCSSHCMWMNEYRNFCMRTY